jgi:hypothetical protein
MFDSKIVCSIFDWVRNRIEREINHLLDLLFGMGKQTKLREIYVVYQKKKGGMGMVNIKVFI